MGALRTVFIALVVFAGIMTGILQFSGGVFDTYGSSIDQTQEFDRFSTLSEEVDNNTRKTIIEQRNQTQESGEEIAADVFIVKSVFDGMFTVFDSLTKTPIIVASFVGFTPLPGWLEDMVIAIFWIVVMFAIWSAITGWDI